MGRLTLHSEGLVGSSRAWVASWQGLTEGDGWATYRLLLQSPLQPMYPPSHNPHPHVCTAAVRIWGRTQMVREGWQTQDTEGSGFQMLDEAQRSTWLTHSRKSWYQREDILQGRWQWQWHWYLVLKVTGRGLDKAGCDLNQLDSSDLAAVTHTSIGAMGIMAMRRRRSGCLKDVGIFCS